MGTFQEFLGSFHLWRDPLIVASMTGCVCGFLGVYVILRRIVFVSVALTQISSFGVVFAFYLQTVLIGSIALVVDPFIFSVVVTSAAALFFGLKEDYFPFSQESIIGFGFILASALLLIMGGWVTESVHKVNDVLFGSAVVVEPFDVFLIPLNAVLIIVIHIILFKDFLFVSYDMETAKLYNYPVVLLNIVLYLTIAFVLALSTRAIGALPVFALLVLPPMFAFQILENIKAVFILSSLIGVISAILGFYFSYSLSLPTGASIAFFCALFFIMSFGLRKIKIVVVSVFENLRG